MGIILVFLGYLFLFGLLGLGFLFLLYSADKMGIIQLPRENMSKALWTFISSLTSSFMFKFGLVAVLTGLMTMPLGMLKKVVDERSRFHSGVLKDISDIWGHKQDLQGPAIFVPYTDKFIDIVPMRNKKGRILYNKKGVERTVKKIRYQKRTAILLPEDLNIAMDVAQKSRSRGLYKAKVYNSDIAVSGYFQQPDNKKFSPNADVVHWEKAWFSFGISDVRAINKISALAWKNKPSLTQKLIFEPGTGMTKVFKSGFHTALPFAKQKKKGQRKGRGRSRRAAKTKKTEGNKKTKTRYEFAFTMNINGSQGLFFYPSGKITQVSMKSDWPHPSFQGNVLPNSRKVSKTGFEARWYIPHLARSFPQFWTLEENSFNLKEFRAGVMMFESVSLYSKVMRAIKYGLLFVGLTYLTFLIFELGIGRRLHIVQYGMIGLALTLFYLTLLSMAEHTGFLKAYITAAAIIITMISLYALAAIRKVGRAVIIAVMLSGLYSTLYTLLQLERYALVSGTAILLIILALMMYLTRNISVEEEV